MSSFTTATTVPEPIIYHELYYPRPSSNSSEQKAVHAADQESFISDLTESTVSEASATDNLDCKDVIQTSSAEKEGAHYPLPDNDNVTAATGFKEENYVQYCATAQFSTLSNDAGPDCCLDEHACEKSVETLDSAAPGFELLVPKSNDSSEQKSESCIFAERSYDESIFVTRQALRSQSFDGNQLYQREVEASSSASHDANFSESANTSAEYISDKVNFSTWSSYAENTNPPEFSDEWPSKISVAQRSSSKKIDEVYRQWNSLEKMQSNKSYVSDEEIPFSPHKSETIKGDLYGLSPNITLPEPGSVPHNFYIDPGDIASQNFSNLQPSLSFESSASCSSSQLPVNLPADSAGINDWVPQAHVSDLSLQQVSGQTLASIYTKLEEDTSELLTQGISNAASAQCSLPFESSQKYFVSGASRGTSRTVENRTSDYIDLKASLISARDEARKCGSRIEEDFLEEWMQCLTGEGSKQIVLDDGSVSASLRDSLCHNYTAKPHSKPLLCSSDPSSANVLENKIDLCSRSDSAVVQNFPSARKTVHFATNDQGSNGPQRIFESTTSTPSTSYESIGLQREGGGGFVGEILDLAGTEKDPELAAVVSHGWLTDARHQVVPPKRGTKKRRSDLCSNLNLLQVCFVDALNSSAATCTHVVHAIVTKLR